MPLLGLWCLAVGQVCGQGTFAGVPLPETVNSVFDESAPRLSPDGRTLYFVRNQHPQNTGGRQGAQDIWISKLGDDGQWSEATLAGANLNNDLHNFVGATGDAVLLLGNAYQERLPGISHSAWSGSGWQPPRSRIVLDNEANPGHSLSFHAPPGFRVLVLSLLNGDRQEDLYVSFLDREGGYSEPRNLGSIVNTPGRETAPFLSADGQTLFFSSDGLGENLGGGDIYMARRLDESWENWSEPVHLGPEVNTAGYDGWFNVHPDGRSAIFVSGPTARDLGDIYRVDLDQVPALQVESRRDTLQVRTAKNKPVELLTAPLGIPDRLAALAQARSLDGQGEILRNATPPYFVYQPAPGFVGRERLLIEHCDPPHSDNCKELYVEARVTEASASQVPELRYRTQRATPVALRMRPTLQDRVDLQRSNALNREAHGSLRWNRETGDEYLRYTPQPDFVGTDTLELVGMCEAMDPRACIVALVLVEVADGPVSVVEVADPELYLHGTLIVEDGRMLPSEVEIELYADGTNRKWGSIRPENNGKFEIRLPKGRDYRLEVNSVFYDTLRVVIPGREDEVERNLILSPMEIREGQTFVLQNIYFETGKSRLLPESYEELKRLYNFLKRNPGIEIEVRGHTDDQASEEFNQQLSEERVFSVINYLKYQGVMGYRLSGKGMGESVPVASNATAEGRARNRRVEFVILKK